MGHSVSKEIILPFTHETLLNCQQKKELRDNAKKKKSKFDAIVLPEQVDGLAGYHASCYRYFCAVSKKAKDTEGNPVIMIIGIHDNIDNHIISIYPNYRCY